MKAVVSVVLVVLGILACGGGTSSDRATGVFDGFLPVLSQSEVTCLESRALPQEEAAIEDFYNYLESREPLPDDASITEVLRGHYRDHIKLMEAFSPIWARCVSPERDADVALHMFENTYGPARAETAACVRNTWQNLDVSETVIGQWAEWAGFESRWVAVNASLEAFEESCVTEVEEVERDVKRFTETSGFGRLTETETDCVRQIARDGGNLPWSMESVMSGDLEHVDKSVFRCITPERFGEIAADHYDSTWPFSLASHQLDCVSDGLSDMWKEFVELDSYPGHVSYGSVTSYFHRILPFTCLSNSQIARLVETVWSESGTTEKVSSKEIWCMRELTKLEIEAHDEWGWAAWTYDLTPEQDAIFEERVQKLADQCWPESE